MAAKTLTTIFVVLLPLATSAATLCEQQEKVYFSCSTKQAKIISVCGSKDFTQKDAYLQYRFGLKEKIELQFPDTKPDSLKKFFYAHYDRYQASSTHLKFTNESSTEYTVFHSYEGDQKKPKDCYGVIILTKSSEKETQVNCKTPAVFELEKLKNFVACDPDDAMNMGSCAPK